MELLGSALIAQGGGDTGGGEIILLLVYGAVIILTIAGLWGMFVKAGEPGWAAIIPIYNTIVLLKIAGRPLWWFLLLLIPCVGFIFAIIIWIDVAKNFGKGGGFAVGLIFLPFIFAPILGFGDARYQSPSGAGA